MACCGVFNLDFSDAQREQWLQQNTKDFLQLSLSDKKSIHEYRVQKEKLIETHRIKKDIYVCPFVGFIEENRGGCLLHPLGSPHPQIKLLQHPQNFSFYGESICQNYLCATAENKMADDSFFTWLSQKFLQSDVSAKKKQAEEKSSACLFTYLKEQNNEQNIFTASRFLPLSLFWKIIKNLKNAFNSRDDENLQTSQATRQKLKQKPKQKNMDEIYCQMEKELQEKNIPVTSFEIWSLQEKDIQDDASALLSALCSRENYVDNKLDLNNFSKKQMKKFTAILQKF